MKYGKIRIEDGFLVFTRHMMINSLPCKDIVWAYMRKEGADEGGDRQLSINYLVIVTRRKKRYKFDMSQREVQDCIRLLRALNPDMATGFPKGGRVLLQSLPDTRDLGAIVTEDGRHILPKRLLRSGALYHISQADKELLMEAYNLKAVIDLRSGAEIRKKPDLIMAGVEYYHIPILEEVSGLCDTGDIRELLQKIPADPWEYVRNFYAQIGTDLYAIKQFARFVDVVYHHEKGALLWHSDTGRGRVGLATALLLALLGVKKDIIYQDYLRTNRYLSSELKYMLRLSQTWPEAGADTEEKLTALYQVREDYLDTAYKSVLEEYGTMERFFRDALYLKPKMIEELREKYLI